MLEYRNIGKNNVLLIIECKNKHIWVSVLRRGENMDSCSKHFMDMPCIFVKDGIITDVNNLFLELSCFSSKDLKHKPFGFIWNDLLRISVEPDFINGYQEAYLFTRSLEARHINIKTEIQSESNSIIYTFLEKPESRLDNNFLFIENLYLRGATGVAIYSATDLILLKANQVLLNFLDKPYNEAGNSIGRNGTTIISGFKGSMLEKNWHNVIKTGEAFDVKEMTYNGFNRGTTYWNMRVVPISEDGVVKYLIQIVDEITQTVINRKKMEKQAKIIKQQKEELEAIIQNMSDALYVIDKSGKVELMNEEARRRFSPLSMSKLSDFLKYTKYYYLDGSEIPYDEIPALRALKGEKIKNIKAIVKQQDREYVAQITSEPIYDEKGNITRSIVCSHDITDLIQKEKTLREQKEQLEIIIENMSDGLCVIDNRGNFIKTNRAFKAFLGDRFGSNPEAKNVDDTIRYGQLYCDENGKVLVPEELPPLKVLKGERVEKQKILFKDDDRETFVSTFAIPIFDDNGKLLYGILLGHDITDEIENQKLINKQKEELEAVIENFDDAIFIYDKDNNNYMQNKAARDYFPNASFENNNEVYTDTKYYYFDGEEIPSEKMINYKVQKGQIVKDDRIKMVQGDNVRYINVSGRPVYNSDKSIRLSILHSRDITEDVNKERIIGEQQKLLLKGEREKQEALKTSMELKDEFLYLITHEFRTPMAVINSALQAIELMYKGEITEKVGNYLKMIKQNTNRQLRLVNNLLDITRINSGSIKMNMSSFDIVHVVRTIVSSVQLYGQQKRVNLSFNSTLEKKDIFSDEEKLERILLNLLANALKFTPSEKSINVILSERSHRGKSMISISVKDEGIGIPKEKQKVIFERFGQVDSSLSRRAEGTGLGLHLVKLLINALDGEIILRSEVDRGSTFTVLLPAYESTASKEGATGDEMNHELLYSNDKVIESVVIEFSDIYL